MSEREAGSGVGSEQAGEDEEAFLAALMARRRRTRRAALGVVVLVLIGVGAMAATLVGEGEEAAGPAVDASQLGEVEAFIFEGEGNTGAIDVTEVHHERFPAWVIHEANVRGGERGEADAALAALREAVAADVNMTRIVDGLAPLLAADPWEHSERVLALFEAWNAYLDEHAIPYHTSALVRRATRGGRGWVSVKFYRVHRALEVRVGERAFGARLMQRADRSNMRETYLGKASGYEEGAKVIIDRISDFTLDEIWPLLIHEARGADVTVALTGLQKNFAPWVIGELRAGLGAEAFETLRASAPDRGALVRVVRVVRERERCGRRAVINYVPWMGFAPQARESFARSAGTGACAIVQPAEAASIARHSAALASTPGLLSALEGLVAWTARKTTVHEARHVADDHAATAQGAPLACEACEEARLDEGARLELSAYLASFADEAVGYTALLQACDLYAQEGGRGSHGRALAFGLARLLDEGCEGALPGDLQARARALEAALFGRSERIELGSGYPTALPVPR